jgi:hypothetical protein
VTVSRSEGEAGVSASIAFDDSQMNRLILQVILRVVSSPPPPGTCIVALVALSLALVVLRVNMKLHCLVSRYFNFDLLCRPVASLRAPHFADVAIPVSRHFLMPVLPHVLSYRQGVKRDTCLIASSFPRPWGLYLALGLDPPFNPTHTTTIRDET